MRSGDHIDWDDIDTFNSYRNMPVDYFLKSEAEFYQQDIALLAPEPLERPTEDALLVKEDSHEAPVFKELTLGNEALPVWAERYRIADSVAKNPFTFIVTETGSGKSTQTPQILLDAGYDVVLTQPRRMAARNVADRVKEELGYKLGKDVAESLVAFETAGEREGPRNARIKVVTDGLEVARQGEDDAIKANVVYVIDELHEDNVNEEVLFAWAKREVIRNPDARFIFISATIDAADRAHHLQEATHRPIPIIEVNTRQYALEMREEPKSNVVDETVKAAVALHNDKSEDGKDYNRVLTFVAGKQEIEDVIDDVRRKLPAHIARDAHIYPLHAKLSPAQQQAAIAKYPGVCITVATEVAQTSLTVEGVKYVVDSGQSRRIETDQEGAHGLMLRDVSKATCRQRGGRAGRLIDGIYILTRPNKNADFVSYADRDDYPIPEIQRTELAGTTLKLAARGFNIAMFDFYHQLDPAAVERAQTVLRNLGALDIDNTVTEQGERMSKFPVSPPVSRMLIESADQKMSQNVRAYMSVIAASKEVGGLPYFARTAGKRWKELTADTSSDLLAQLDIFVATQKMTHTELAEYDLDVQNVVRAREQYQKIAKRLSAHKEILLPPTDDERDQLKRCIYAGSVNNMFIHVGAGKYQHLGGTVTTREISNRSIIKGRPEALVGDRYRVEYYAQGSLVENDIIEHPTAATVQALGAAAVNFTRMEPGEYVWRGDKLMQRRSKWLFDIKLADTDEVEADQTALGFRDQIISRVLEKPGEHQRAVRLVKKQLEKLAVMAGNVPQFSQNSLLALISRATEDGVTEMHVIDQRIGQLAQDEDIHLDAFVSAERREEIERNSPPIIRVSDLEFKIAYKGGQPIVHERYVNADAIAELKDEILLPDGRAVRFIVEGKPKTLAQLKALPAYRRSASMAV